MFIYLTHVRYTFSCISAYIKRFRYCEYLGKYFCQCCHRNEINYIPGHIIRKWDFKQYPVSNFSWRLLSRIFNEPYFNLSTINPSLFNEWSCWRQSMLLECSSCICVNFSGFVNIQKGELKPLVYFSCL